MPDTYGHDFTITVMFSSRHDRADVVLGGDLDIAACPDLTDAVHELAATSPALVAVDLAAVGHVGAVLPNFLVQVRQALPGMFALTVSQPSIMAAFVLAVTDMAQIAKIDDPVAG